MSYITFPRQEWDFPTLLDSYMALVQKLINMTFNFKNARVERLSFVDYVNQRFFPNFPLEKRLCVHNTSTMDKFGYGRYSGFFFDVILRLENGNPMNFRIFYGIDEEAQESVPGPSQEPSLCDPSQSGQVPEPLAGDPSPCDPLPPSGDTIYILGADRKYVKKGRATYIEYEGKLISLTEAKKLERKANK
jgi:hypothetical protein